MKKYFIFFVICFCIFIAHLILAGHGIYGDGNAYYSYTQALYFDKGLNFAPIYSHLANFQGPKYIFSRIFWNTQYNPYPLGAGILWLPSIALISLFSSDRFSLIYEVGPGLSGILFVLAGLYFLEKYLQNFFSKKVAFLSVIFFFFASNLFYYSSFEPALSHQPAFFFTSYLLYKTYKMRAGIFNFFTVGALSGLLFITRIPDSIFLIPIFWQIHKSRPSLKYWAVTFMSAFFFTLPLFLSYRIMFGNLFHMPYLTGESGVFNFSPDQITEFFFSAKRGLFIWTPIYLIGLVGLLRRVHLPIIATIAIFFLVSSFWSANTSAGFGQRFAIGAVPYFTVGLSEILTRISIRFRSAIFSTLLVWNFLTLFQFYFDSSNLVKNENLTLPAFLKGQIQSPIKAFKIVKERGIGYFFYRNILD